MQVALYPHDNATFEAVLAASGLTRSGWIRGAIRAAASDPDIAWAITEAGDHMGHGGIRPGAGRPAQGSTQEKQSYEEERQ